MLSRLFAALVAAVLLASPAFAKPLVVILTDPKGTVAADVLTPYAILAESGAVEVKVISPTLAPVRLYPGHAWLQPQWRTGDLPRTPDVIIVPAVTDEHDPVRNAWLRAQQAAGARIFAICNGAKILADAELLEGRQAAIHWFSQGRMRKQHPKVRWRRDVRWITDGPVTTTSGISAAEPAALHLLSELAGEDVMRSTAQRLALDLPVQAHNGEAFRLTLGRMATVSGNVLAFWRKEDVAIPIAPGFDELAFGQALEGWSRTYRSQGWAEGAPSAVSRRGLVIYRSRQRPERFDRTVELPQGDATLSTFHAIRRAYGRRTARFVATQFEHPWGLAG